VASDRGCASGPGPVRIQGEWRRVGGRGGAGGVVPRVGFMEATNLCLIVFTPLHPCLASSAMIYLRIREQCHVPMAKGRPGARGAWRRPRATCAQTRRVNTNNKQ